MKFILKRFLVPFDEESGESNVIEISDDEVLYGVRPINEKMVEVLVMVPMDEVVFEQDLEVELTEGVGFA